MPTARSAMVAAIMLEAGRIDHRLPGGIDIARRPTGDKSGDDGVERGDGDLGHCRVLCGDLPEMNEAAERGVVARDAARQLEEHRLAGAVGESPQVACSSPSRRPEEGAEAGGSPPAFTMAARHEAATSRSVAPSWTAAIAAVAALSVTAAA